MTRSELIENLGTIAHSGSKQFLNALKESESVTRTLWSIWCWVLLCFYGGRQSRCLHAQLANDGESLHWSSDGSGAYEIAVVENERRGTRILIHLKDQYKDFAKRILRRYH